jgi:hypothetical protein
MNHIPLTDAIKRQFVDMSCSLSPENLTKDGQIPRSQWQKKLNNLQHDWRELEEQIGIKVTEEMSWKWDKELKNS